MFYKPVSFAEFMAKKEGRDVHLPSIAHSLQPRDRVIREIVQTDEGNHKNNGPVMRLPH